MDNKKILIVEDEAALATTLKDRLRKEGYQVKVAKDGLSGFTLASGEPFDLIVLDLMLPGQSGLVVCQKLREIGSSTPILMLTARRQLADKVAGLKTGADDYLTKPFHTVELLARIEALIRRGQPAAAGVRHQFGPVCVDLRRTEVSRDGRAVSVSAKEFQLLRYFVEHRGAT
jgi:DNA-binding response OmpR family regulator